MIEALSYEDTTTPTLTEAIHGLFDIPVSVVLSDPKAPDDGLMGPETEAMARASEARRREFAAGRRAAREAMLLMGRRRVPVPAGPDRAPIWPTGLTGSISHNDSTCIATLAERHATRSLGIDIEDDTALAADLVQEVCTLAERAWLASQPQAARLRLAKLLFSAKECAFKCQYPVSGEMFDFQTLDITPDLDTGQFEATFTRDVPGFARNACVPGRFERVDGMIVTGMALTPGPRWQ